MVKLMIDKRLKSIATSFYKSKSVYKIINKQLYYFLDKYPGQKKVELNGSFSDIDLYCNQESLYYRELNDFFNTNKKVIFFGYDNNFSKYLFWQYINEFNLDARIILKSRNGISNYEYSINHEDIRKSLAIYYLNFLVSKEIDKEFKLVNIYEAFLLNEKENNELVNKKNEVEIENFLLYTKKRSLYIEFDIKKKIITDYGIQFLIREFYQFSPGKKDIKIIIYILEKYNVLKSVNNGAEKNFIFSNIQDIIKLNASELNSILLDFEYVELSRPLVLKTKKMEVNYIPSTAFLKQVSNIDYTKEINDISLIFHNFLISISSLLHEIFLKDFFSNFITSNNYYAIRTDKLEEIIHDIGLYYPIKLKIIEEVVALKLQEDLTKKDEYKNLNELVLKNDLEYHKIYKSDYQIYKLAYIAKVKPNLVNRKNLKEIDHSISSFMDSDINYQQFRSKINRLLNINSTPEY